MNFPVPTPGLEKLHPSLQILTAEIVREAPIQKVPVLIQELGIPASGKTTLRRHLLDHIPDLHMTCVSFDDLMHAIPEYDQEPDQVIAFQKYEPPAADAGYSLIERLIAKRANIIFDHSGARASHVQILTFAKECGYKIVTAHMIAEPADVIERMKAREKREGRHTPPHYLQMRYEALQQLLEDYHTVTDLKFSVHNKTQSGDAYEAGIDAAARALSYEIRGLMITAELHTQGTRFEP